MTALQKHKEYVGKVEEQVMLALADLIVNKLILYSPVKSGKYVRSFEVGRGSPSLGNTSSSVFGPDLPYGQRASLKKSEKNRLKRQIKALIRKAPDKQVSVGNSAGHALQVEHVGWDKTPAYRVFGKTVASVRLNVTGMLKKAIIKVRKP